MKAKTGENLVKAWRRRAAWGVLVAVLTFALGGAGWRELRHAQAGEFADSVVSGPYRSAEANMRFNVNEFWIIRTGRFFQIHLLRVQEHVPAHASVLVVTPWMGEAFEVKAKFWLYPRRVTMGSAEKIAGRLPEDGDWEYLAFMGRTKQLNGCQNRNAFDEVCPSIYSGKPQPGVGVSAILRRQ